MKSLLLAGLIATAPAMALELDTDEKKLAYALGAIVGERIYQDFGEVDYDALVEGVKSAANPDERLLSREEVGQVLQQAQQALQERAQLEQQAAGEATRVAGEAFLKANAGKEGVTVTDSGLQIRFIEKGEGGAMPTASDRVEVHYHGTLIDGTVFDSSVDRGETVTFPVNGVIPGWVEGLQLMSEGDKAEFVIPQELAYGPGGAGRIPPFSTLVFEVELVKINP